ncbi:MAG: protein-disulfide reductase DsbD domain-containing protein [Phycisphaerales bacterium JB038]
MLLLALGHARAAAAPPRDDSEAPLVTASIVSDVAAITPGAVFHIGVQFEIEEDWAIYWRNPGSSGLETNLDLELPKGLSAGEILWPGPQRKESPGGLLDYVYRDEAMLIVPVRASTSLAPGAELDIRLLASWLACKERCVLGDAVLSLTLPVATETAPSRDADLLRKQLAKLPRPLEKSEGVCSIAWDNDMLTIELPSAERLAFFPHESDDWELIDPARHGAADAGRLELPIRFTLNDPALQVTGVLAVTDADEQVTYLTINSARQPKAD